MATLLTYTDDLLRGGPLTTAPARPRRLLVGLVGIVVLFGMLYGGVMGSSGGRLWQSTFSAVKVPMLLGITFALSLPSFYVLNQLAGVGSDFPVVLRGLVVTQAALTAILASLAPFTAFWYVSFPGYESALTLNMAMFTIASVSAQLLLRRYYRPLIAGNSRHRTLLRTWLLIYAFVGIQMGWTLRPFIGNPGVQTRFIRHPAWGNAYVEVGEVLLRLVR